MKLPALALFERALRLESRSALFCWSRVGLLGIILFFLIPIQTMSRYGLYAAPGLSFIEEMVWVNLIFITLAGMGYFASAITEEKEEMTLGLLRMTDLNPIAILLGKSTSRLIGALLFLLVQVPFILLAVALGGVGLLQIAAAFGSLLAYLFLLCNLALLFSVVFRNTATAAAFTLLFILFFFFGHNWAAGLASWMASSFNLDINRGFLGAFTATIDLWQRATPPTTLGAIFQTGFSGPVVGFQIISNLVLGVLLFLLAWMVFDRFTREEKDATPVRFPWQRRASRRSRIPARLVGAGAITWKDFTFISGGSLGLLTKFTVIGLLVVLLNAIALNNRTSLTLEFEGGILIWISLISTAVLLAFEAARLFKDEIRWKTLSSLVTLPMSIRELAYRKVIGALKGTLPLLVPFVIGLTLIPDDVGKFLDEANRNPIILGVLAVVILQYILFLHLTAFLSLILKRGALPLAIGIQYLGGSFFFGIASAFLFQGDSDTISFFTAIFCIVATIVLHRAIGVRLARAAAEE